MPELLHGTTYALRPIYEELIAELGDPPRGFPEACRFKWPDTSEADLLALAEELAEAKRQFHDEVTKLARNHHRDVKRDSNGRFTKKEGDDSE